MRWPASPEHSGLPGMSTLDRHTWKPGSHDLERIRLARKRSKHFSLAAWSESEHVGRALAPHHGAVQGAGGSREDRAMRRSVNRPRIRAAREHTFRARRSSDKRTLVAWTADGRCRHRRCRIRVRPPPVALRLTLSRLVSLCLALSRNISAKPPIKTLQKTPQKPMWDHTCGTVRGAWSVRACRTRSSGSFVPIFSHGAARTLR